MQKFVSYLLLLFLLGIVGFLFIDYHKIKRHYSLLYRQKKQLQIMKKAVQHDFVSYRPSPFIEPVIKPKPNVDISQAPSIIEPVSQHKPSLKSFVWPIERSSFWLSSKFGSRKKDNGSWGYHYGIDMAAPKGTPVMTAASGFIIEACYSTKGYGKTVVVVHNNKNYQTRYAHLDAVYVKVGQKVKQGMCIGAVGDTGFVRGENGGKNAYHLHFEVKKNGEHIDPLCVLT